MLDQTNLSVMLKNKNLLKNKAYVNGAWVDAKSGKSFEVVNPSTGDLIVTVPDLDVDDARISINAAHEAFPSWSKKTAKERSHTWSTCPEGKRTKALVKTAKRIASANDEDGG